MPMTQSGSQLDEIGWTPATLLNGWTTYGDLNYSTTGAITGFTRRGQLVSLAGLIVPGTAGVPAYLLPPGYRPAKARIFVCQASSGTADVRVDSLGNILPQSSPPWISLANINFIAEQ